MRSTSSAPSHQPQNSSDKADILSRKIHKIILDLSNEIHPRNTSTTNLPHRRDINQGGQGTLAKRITPKIETLLQKEAESSTEYLRRISQISIGQTLSLHPDTLIHEAHQFREVFTPFREELSRTVSLLDFLRFLERVFQADHTPHLASAFKKASNNIQKLHLSDTSTEVARILQTSPEITSRISQENIESFFENVGHQFFVTFQEVLDKNIQNIPAERLRISKRLGSQQGFMETPRGKNYEISSQENITKVSSHLNDILNQFSIFIESLRDAHLPEASSDSWLQGTLMTIRSYLEWLARDYKEHAARESAEWAGMETGAWIRAVLLPFINKLRIDIGVQGKNLLHEHSEKFQKHHVLEILLPETYIYSQDPQKITHKEFSFTPEERKIIDTQLSEKKEHKEICTLLNEKFHGGLSFRKEEDIAAYIQQKTVQTPAAEMSDTKPKHRDAHSDNVRIDTPRQKIISPSEERPAVSIDTSSIKPEEKTPSGQTSVTPKPSMQESLPLISPKMSPSPSSKMSPSPSSNVPTSEPQHNSSLILGEELFNTAYQEATRDIRSDIENMLKKPSLSAEDLLRASETIKRIDAIREHVQNEVLKVYEKGIQDLGEIKSAIKQ